MPILDWMGGKTPSCLIALLIPSDQTRHQSPSRPTTLKHDRPIDLTHGGGRDDVIEENPLGSCQYAMLKEPAKVSVPLNKTCQGVDPFKPFTSHLAVKIMLWVATSINLTPILGNGTNNPSN